MSESAAGGVLDTGVGPIDASIGSRIQVVYDALSPQEQRVAAFLQRRPDESALYNSSELARLTGVSKATVSRLFRRLGFADSREARSVLRAQRRSGVPVAVDVQSDAASAQLDRDIANLRRCYESLDQQRLDTIAAAIAEAGRVLVIGFRSAYPMALHLRTQLAQLRPDVSLAPQPGQSMAEEIAGLGERDVAVVFGLRRRPDGFAALLAALEAGPSRVLLIADPGLRHSGVEWRLELPVQSASAFDSFAAVASVVSLLAGAVLDALGEAGERRVSEVQGEYARLAELER